MRYFLEIQYKGTGYHGWQRQSEVPSVQQTLEESLEKILRKPMLVHGCGRTDAGVHASQYFVHFDLDELPDFGLVKRLNQVLPKDIAALKFFPVDNKLNAQLDATFRTYIYKIHDSKNPFLSETSSFYPMKEMNFDLVKKIAGLISGEADFKAFCKRPNLYKHTSCTILKSEWSYDPQLGVYQYTITANRFLQGMVRLLTGTMLDVGRGSLSVDQFREHLVAQTPLRFYNYAYPQGLYLAEVTYEKGIKKDP